MGTPMLLRVCAFAAVLAMCNAREIRSTSISEMITTVIDVHDYIDAARDAFFGKAQKNAGENWIDYGKDYISDGGGDIFDGGFYLEVAAYKDGGSLEWEQMGYTRQHGPKAGQLLTQVHNGYTFRTVTYGKAQKRVAIFLVKMADDSPMYGVKVTGELGTSSDYMTKSSGAFTQDGVSYQYFMQYRREETDDGHMEAWVVNTAGDTKHCIGADCADVDSDYDYHRVLYWGKMQNSFTQAGIWMAAIPYHVIVVDYEAKTDDSYTTQLDTLAQDWSKALAGVMHNML